MGNLIAIVGRPNVGKSTLFNRLTGTRQAIVSAEAGTTRDRQYGKTIWNGREISLVDTGGWVVNSDDIFEEEIRKQVLIAAEEADLILFMVDVKNGVTDLDSEVAGILRRTKLPVLLVANKADNNEDRFYAAEFYALGLGDPYCISAATGSGTGDLLDAIVERLKPETEEENEDILPRIAVVGRPNAGKSSLINAFIGENRHIVTDIAGTTRDSILTRYNKFGFDFYLVDTAGIRRKNKVTEDLEFYSVMRSIRAIEHSDVCILMIDATRGIESQDMNIFQLIQRNNKSLVVVVNKWDIAADKSQKAMKHFPIDLLGKTAADIGASTGGFTDCMLQNGAAKVYAVDVGYGQLAWSLRSDERVVVLERTNARYLSHNEIPDVLDFASIDVSFISLKLILPALRQLMSEDGEVVATFCFSVGEDPTYARIEGEWLDQAPYGVIHRLASNGKAKGVARQCIAWCFARHTNLRADTHADNLIMQKSLEDNGFQKCGIIYTRESPRIAYQKR